VTDRTAVLVDPHPSIRLGLRAVLAEAGFSVIAEGDDMKSGRALVRISGPPSSSWKPCFQTETESPWAPRSRDRGAERASWFSPLKRRSPSVAEHRSSESPHTC
jgi:hypothetical protein